MANWPSIAAPRTIEEEWYRPQIQTEFDANYAQSRAACSRTIHRWFLGHILSDSDLNTLYTFFNANQGLTITWTNPRNTTSYPVKFRGDSIRAKNVGMSGAVNYWSLDVILEEI